MKVLYPGSFNPFHNGHQYVYDLACQLFGRKNVWLGIGQNKDKPDNPSALRTIRPITENVIQYKCLTAQIVTEQNFDLIIRGIRPGKSLEYEEDFMHWNMELANVKTIFIPTPPAVNKISSSIIRELVDHSMGDAALRYMNEDVYWRWRHKDCCEFHVFFGKTCSGKSTALKSYAPQELMVANVDDLIWKYANIKYSANFKESFKKAFYEKNKEDYDLHLRELAFRVDWSALFFKGSFRVIDFPVIGNYWEFIPPDVRSRLKLTRITTSEINRKLFAFSRAVNPQLLDCADFFYKEPPFFDSEIVIDYKAQ